MDIKEYEKLNDEANDESIIKIQGKKFEYKLMLPDSLECTVEMGAFGEVLEQIRKSGSEGKLLLEPEQAENLIIFGEHLAERSSIEPRISVDGKEGTLKFRDLCPDDRNLIFIELFNALGISAHEIRQLRFFRSKQTRQKSVVALRNDQNPTNNNNGSGKKKHPTELPPSPAGKLDDKGPRGDN